MNNDLANLTKEQQELERLLKDSKIDTEVIKREAKRLEEDAFKKAMEISMSQYRYVMRLPNNVDVLSHLNASNLFRYNCFKQAKIEEIMAMAGVKLDYSMVKQVKRKAQSGTLSTEVMAEMLQWPHETIIEQFEGLFKADETLPRVELEEGVFLLNYVQANVIATGLSWDYMKAFVNVVSETTKQTDQPTPFLDGFVEQVKSDDKLIKRMTTNKDAGDFVQ